MIAKRAKMREQRRSHFGELIKYLMDDRYHHRVLGVNLTNCVSDSVEWATEEILALQNQNTRSAADKTYHLIVSFPPGERPENEVLQKIEAQICEGLGYGQDYPRVSLLHGDRNHLHFHCAICRVSARTLAVHEPYYDYLKLQTLCKKLEIEHGLTITNHEIDRKVGKHREFEYYTGTESLTNYMKTELAEKLKAVASWQDLHSAINTHGIEAKLRGNGLVFAAKVENGEAIHIKASSVARELSKASLEKRLGEFTPAVENIQRPEIPAHVQRPTDRDKFDYSRLWAEYQRRRQAEVTQAPARTYRVSGDLDAVFQAHAVRKGLINFIGGELRGVNHMLNNVLLRQEIKRAASIQRKPPTFKRFLESEARAGNAEAAEALRAKQGIRPDDDQRRHQHQHRRGPKL